MSAPTPPSPEPSPRPRRPHKEPADRAAPPAKGGSGEPVLRRTVVKPGGLVPDPVDAAYVASRLTALTHELANLLDGSLRVISLARRSAGDESPEQTTRHIETVYAAMLQMAELVRNSMSGLVPVGPDAMRQAFGAGGTLAAAVGHAVNVMKPVAEERSIELTSECGDDIADVPAGPIYGVVINAIKNSIEAIDRAGHPSGRILVRAWLEAGRTGRSVGIEIVDDGAGPPTLPSAAPLSQRPSATRPAKGTRAAQTVFDPGFTTKPGSAGIGLALCKEVIDHLGGTIELTPGHGGGAVLRVRYPAPASMLDRRVG